MTAYPALLDFVGRVQRARGIKTSEFRITTEEANKIALEISKLMLTKTIEIEKQKPSGLIDGGNFQ